MYLAVDSYYKDMFKELIVLQPTSNPICKLYQIVYILHSNVAVRLTGVINVYSGLFLYYIQQVCSRRFSYRLGKNSKIIYEYKEWNNVETLRQKERFVTMFLKVVC